MPLDILNNSAFESHAFFPLTVFDKMFERNAFVTGWLLEGAIDTAALAVALASVTQKWRMLAGRVQSVKEGENVKWYIKIPLGPIPHDYPTYALTISTSTVPLSTYVALPLPTFSNSLPLSIFLHESTPRQYATWASTDHPLTCWNVVHFPASQNNGVDYTCIGFARSHGIFDGSGAAQIMNALVAEMRGDAWTPPSLPHVHEGFYVNPIDDILSRATVANSSLESSDYKAYSRLGIPGYLQLIAWHARERWWRGADRRVVLIPKNVLTRLVEEVRVTTRHDDPTERVSTGDILSAWIFKTIYSTETRSKMRIFCTNLASFRSLLLGNMGSTLYPHNAFIPLPYPVLSVGDVQSYSLPALTNIFSACRKSLAVRHVVEAYQHLKQTSFPSPPTAHETLTISNVSASRILESDWSPIGSKRTLCGYRYQATPLGVMFTNAVYIAGRLDDGSVVLDVTLNKARFDLLTADINRLAGGVCGSTHDSNVSGRRPP